jgi:hypothetical protein
MTARNETEMGVVALARWSRGAEPAQALADAAREYVAVAFGRGRVVVVVACAQRDNADACSGGCRG